MPKHRLKLPCPYCGHPIMITERQLRVNPEFDVVCTKCKMMFSARELAKVLSRNTPASEPKTK